MNQKIEDTRTDIKSMSAEELEEFVVKLGDKKFRGSADFSMAASEACHFV